MLQEVNSNTNQSLDNLSLLFEPQAQKLLVGKFHRDQNELGPESTGYQGSVGGGPLHYSATGMRLWLELDPWPEPQVQQFSQKS